MLRESRSRPLAEDEIPFKCHLRPRTNGLSGQSHFSGEKIGAIGVMGDDLGVFVGTIACDAFEMSSKSLVEVSAILLGERAVGHVSNQEVLEPKAAAVGRCHILEHKAGPQQVLQGCRRVDASERRDLFRGKAFTNDAGGLERLLLGIGKRVEARRQQGLDRFGNAYFLRSGLGLPTLLDVQQLTLVDQHPEKFLAKERIPFRAFEELLVKGWGNVLDFEQP